MTRFALLLLLAACKKEAPPAAPTGPAIVWPEELQCADGAVPAGKPPPHGTEAWCQLVLATGAVHRHGTQLTWHENGQLASRGELAYDRQDGTWSWWYPNGQLEKEGVFANGKAEGAWVEYHPDGSRMAEGSMIDGLRDGDWTFWTEAGTVVYGRFVLGAEEGVWSEKDADGKLLLERFYRRGRLLKQVDHTLR